jgi:hypothetical protein
LFETKHKVDRLEGSSVYPSAVVIAEALLINCRSNEGYVSRFIQQIAGVFQRCLRILFDIGLDTGCTEPHICRSTASAPNSRKNGV